ncbi:ABC transporter permease [Streptomyces spiroverticillatus]|uniref:ABC transporter permease n=1 Tax=Streptomyces finlayi TaxID=67296 RepID=A0A919CAP9_9ACTN|nr:ABC transporter permease [Streptomyces finlayi]GHA14417.1 ABC transporter permease [Streptomyces spiroverticillatus]GHC97338.1 ABC transporter permease [Streptomyces finlayi]
MTIALPAATVPRPRFRDLLASEWLKLWSLRPTRWAFPLTALIVVGIGVNGALADYRNFPQYSEGVRENFVPTWALRDAFPVASAMVLMLIVGTLGALSVVNEYASGLIRTTMAAVPARRSLLSAKVLVVTGVTAVFGVAVVAVSFTVTQAILSGRGVSLSFGDPDVLPSLAASAALAPMSALVGLGFGVLLRHGAATVAVTALVLVLLPSFVGQEEAWTAAVKFALPLNAWQNLATVAPLHVPPPYTPSPTHSWVVLAVWPLLATAAALALVRRRDL